MRLDLILAMRDIYFNSNLKLLTKFTSSYRSIEFKDILRWNISQKITKTVLISTRIVISYMMKWKLSQQHDHNLSMEGKPLLEKY